LEVAAVDQYPIINGKFPGIFNVDGASLNVYLLEGMVDLVMYGSHSIEPFFGSGRGEFIVIIEMDGIGVPAIEAAVRGVLVGRMRGHVVGKLGKCKPSFPSFLSIMAEDVEVLLEGLDGSFTESISLRMVDSG
jgi:hypothetical protein